MKHMKKSMFITTLAMVVVLVVALSTATFAWYTANTTTKVNETTVVAANSNSASLVIDYVAVNSDMASQSNIDIVMTSNIQPMIYNGTAAPAAGTTTYDDFVANFATYTVNNDGTYASLPIAASPSIISTVTGTSTNEQDEFYVTNIGKKSAALNATVTINPNYYVDKGALAADTNVEGLYTLSNSTYTVQESGAKADGTSHYYELKANNYLRVALFVDGIYKGVWSLNGTTNQAQYANVNLLPETPTISVGDTPNTHQAFTTTTTSGNAISNLKTLSTQFSYAEISLVAWFEGDVHTNALSGTGALFSINFTASNPS